MDNPIQKILDQNSLRQGELAIILNSSPERVSNYVTGAKKQITKKDLDAFAEIGFDVEKLQAEYLAWQSEKRKKAISNFLSKK